MADVSDRRREPKGIPTGGEFAKENSGAADAADLEEAAFERAEREADEYYSSLTDEELERQWAEEFGRTLGPPTPEGRRDPDPERGAGGEPERQRAERTGSHPVPQPPAAPKGGTGPGVDPERDRFWGALADQRAGRGTRLRVRQVAAEAEAGRSGADSGVRKTPTPARKRSGPAHSEPRHPRLVRFASTAGKAGAVVLGGFLGVVRRVLAPLGRR